MVVAGVMGVVVLLTEYRQVRVVVLVIQLSCKALALGV